MPLTKEKLVSSLSNLQKVIDGNGYAYTKLNLKVLMLREIREEKKKN